MPRGLPRTREPLEQASPASTPPPLPRRRRERRISTVVRPIGSPLVSAPGRAPCWAAFDDRFSIIWGRAGRGPRGHVSPLRRDVRPHRPPDVEPVPAVAGGPPRAHGCAGPPHGGSELHRAPCSRAAGEQVGERAFEAAPRGGDAPPEFCRCSSSASSVPVPGRAGPAGSGEDPDRSAELVRGDGEEVRLVVGCLLESWTLASASRAFAALGQRRTPPGRWAIRRSEYVTGDLGEAESSPRPRRGPP